MRNFALLLLFAPCLLTAQGRGTTVPVAAGAVGREFVRENYTKFEYRVPMRDGVKLFTSVYVPKDVFTDGKTYPIMMQRTGYNVAPYGIDQYRASLGPSELFAREKFIFVYQDIRGRYMSEGDYVVIRPHKPVKSGPKDTDESTDTYDTIDWLIKNVPGNTGKVGHVRHLAARLLRHRRHDRRASGAGRGGAAGAGHRLLHGRRFLSQRRVHAGAPLQFLHGIPRPRRRIRNCRSLPRPSSSARPTATISISNMGSLANADEKYFKHKQPLWNLNIDHTTYDEVWQSRAIWKYLKNIKPAVMLVGGWYDTEDPQGLLRQHEFMEKNGPPAVDMLVMGPWNHGGFARGDGDRLGNVNFGSKTAVYYRERIELPFFLYYLKGKGDGKFPQGVRLSDRDEPVAQVRRAGRPPTPSPPPSIWTQKAKLAWQPPAQAAFDEYLSDPNKPVPYIGALATRVLNSYMTEDQRFAAARPDVLVYKTRRAGSRRHRVRPDRRRPARSPPPAPIRDFDVKIIDVYPGDTPDYNAPAPAPAAPGAPPAAAAASLMGGYQQLVRGEPFRGKFRKSFEKPVPFEPGKPDRITFALPDIAHTFRAGHRIMVQIQSSWFPLTDRNPQKFMEIPKALSADFVKATQRVYTGGADGSKITFRIEE